VDGDVASLRESIVALDVTLGHVSAGLAELKDQFSRWAAGHQERYEKLEDRLKIVEEHASKTRGFWVAITVISSLVGVGAAIVGMLVGMSKLSGHS
jgi:hypothetical protein